MMTTASTAVNVSVCVSGCVHVQVGPVTVHLRHTELAELVARGAKALAMLEERRGPRANSIVSEVPQ